MTTNEWKQFVDALIGGVEPGAVTASSVPRVTASALEATSGFAGEVERLAASMYVRPPVEPQPTARKTTSPTVGIAERIGDPRASLVKTIGMFTGIGPIATGLLKLFGRGGGDDQPEAEPVPYAIPTPIAVQAGLRGDGSVAPVSYGTYDAPRAVQASSSAAQIQIHVQAMDSKSFMDNSDLIARAVRQAMLQSHSLNDIVAEI